MAEHSPEPWKLIRDYFIEDIEGTSVVDEDGIVQPADARRIVACVNACVDIETADLEKMPPRFLVELLVKLGEITPP